MKKHRSSFAVCIANEGCDDLQVWKLLTLALAKRGGTVDYLELVQDILARQEAQQLLSQLDWERLLETSRPPQSWFEGDEPQPF